LGCSGRNGGQRNPRRVASLRLALDAGARHTAFQTGSVALEIGDAAQDQNSSLNEEIRRVEGSKEEKYIWQVEGD